MDGITDSMDVNLNNLRELAIDTEAWHAVVHGIAELDMTEQLNRTEILPISLPRVETMCISINTE